MKTIWKFPLETTDSQDLTMPSGSEVLHVDVQHEIPCLWVLVETENKPCKRSFSVYGTGHKIPNGQNINKYIGSYMLNGGLLVFHVFEK